MSSRFYKHTNNIKAPPQKIKYEFMLFLLHLVNKPLFLQHKLADNHWLLYSKWVKFSLFCLKLVLNVVETICYIDCVLKEPDSRSRCQTAVFFSPIFIALGQKSHYFTGKFGESFSFFFLSYLKFLLVTFSSTSTVTKNNKPLKKKKKDEKCGPRNAGRLEERAACSDPMAAGETPGHMELGFRSKQLVK